MNFFNPDHFLWRFLAKLADLFFLSICWLVCSIPLITVGSASIALYDSVSHCLRHDEGGTYKRFFRTFRAEVKRGIALTLLWSVIAFVVSVGYQILYQSSSESSVFATVTIAYYVFLLIPVAMVCWIVALESRFVYSFSKLHQSATVLTFAKLPTSVAITALLLAGFELIIRFPFFLMFLPATVSYFQSWFIERVFQKIAPTSVPEETE